MLKIEQTESTKVQNTIDLTKRLHDNCVPAYDTPELASKNSLLLDTLAQPATNGKITLKKRAKAKFFTNRIIYPLVDLDSPLKKSYWNSYHCVETLLQDGKKITGKYCNNRWCIVCNRITTAKLINGYKEKLQELEDLRMVTLTIPNVSGDCLSAAIDEMLREIAKIQKLFRERRDYRIDGVRKIECTYNEKENTYHPHFHLALDGDGVGVQLINEWLKRYPGANRICQDNRPADAGKLVELFKYFTKMHTVVIRNGKKEITMYPAQVLDTIFQAMRGRRVFQPMGGIKKVSEDVDPEEATVFVQDEEIEIWGWVQDVSDWISGQGECLTECEIYKRYENKTKIKLE